MKKIILSIILFVFVTGNLLAQRKATASLLELEHFIQQNKQLVTDTTNPFLSMLEKGRIQYFKPLYKAFALKNELVDTHGLPAYNEDVAQALAFAGDYQSALYYQEQASEPLPDSYIDTVTKKVEALNNLQMVPAIPFILKQAGNRSIVLINESHSKPQHRAFAIVLLEGLYQQGFRYLAMETLNPYKNASLKQLTVQTGYYTSEPVCGELVRKALQMGFTLLPYEDENANRLSNNQRDSMQAVHLAHFMKKHPSEKIVVLAGYEHTAQLAWDRESIPMAVYLRYLSGIKPLSIDQTEMTEGSNSDYGRLYYAAFVHQHNIKQTVIPLRNNIPVQLLDSGVYDMYVVHPPTKYQDGRPAWYNFNNTRKEIPVSPAYKTLFFVQAFYKNEWGEKEEGIYIPADQTFVNAENGFYYLYLYPGKYQIVYRDKAYAILGTKEIAVQ
ncbi:MAG: hypothetical protein EKK39_00990 [Sphingobacteriales bacterium]|uniref:hypothetical protein n=1 Tax=Hydrotalea flava TaxID=714549 RepID=UPI00082FD4F3|nr:hypothetical protein [Hydrotalea flava]RTL56677.1 MAG: hypothetical protein EKK39_00990 [Sphingobacteriales bacterium]